jgi:hypothetical protein
VVLLSKPNLISEGVTMIDERTRQFAASSIFPSLFFGALGFVLTQAGVTRMSGSWVLHVVLGVPGITLSGLALYRARLHWGTGVRETTGQNGSQKFSKREFAWCVLLFATGIVIAFSAGSFFLLGIAATLMYLVPWAKIPVCRTRFIVSSVTTLAGAIASLALYGNLGHPLYFVGAAWMVMIPAMTTTFLVVVSLPYGYRISEQVLVGNPDVDAPQSLPQ